MAIAQPQNLEKWQRGRFDAERLSIIKVKMNLKMKSLYYNGLLAMFKVEIINS